MLKDEVEKVLWSLLETPINTTRNKNGVLINGSYEKQKKKIISQALTRILELVEKEKGGKMEDKIIRHKKANPMTQISNEEERELRKIFQKHQSEGCKYCGGGEGEIYISEEDWDNLITTIKEKYISKQEVTYLKEQLLKWQYETKQLKDACRAILKLDEPKNPKTL